MRVPHRRALVAAGLFLATPLAAQTQVAFPMTDAGPHAGTGLPTLEPSPGASGAFRALAALDHVILTGVPLPSGELVSLELRRIRIENIELGFRVDGAPAPDLLDGLDLSVWTGAVVADPGSEALLSFSQAGTRGWVQTRGTLAHLMPQPDEDWDWSRGYSILVDEGELARLGALPNLDCGLDRIETLSPDAVPDGSGTSTEAGALKLFACKVDVETDYQLNQVFGGSLAAETAYVTSLLAASSDRYLEQHRTKLEYPYVMFYTSPADPWSTPESGGSMIDMLNEFVNAWQGSLPVPANLAHFVSGASLGGGVAYLDVLCDTGNQFSFAVSGNIDGLVPFPVVQGPLNWDFMVFNHETGHNFGSPHTHDYNPPIDQCAFGVCITDGTLMSYCHQCPGGLSNVTTYFHPIVVDFVAPFVDNCLPVVVAIETFPPAFVPPSTPTTLSVTVTGSPAGTVDLNYRFDALSSFTAVAMVPQGGGVYAGDLPAPACADDPEFFFSMTEASFGYVQTDVFTAGVGTVTSLFSDDFQADLGWTVGAPGDDATTGIWTRVDPLGTAAQPSEGVDTGTGPFCYVTGQGSPGGSLGENDVDGGKTTLVSPVIDLSSGSALVSYWRWYSNQTGASPDNDVFEVEVTNDGSTWVDVETVGPSGPETNGGWFYHEFDVSSFVAPSAQVQVRFIASDEGDGSIVEAALDEFQVFRVDCGVTCQPDVGFGGPGTTVLTLCGDVLAPGGTATLALTGAPALAPAWIGYSTSFNPTAMLGGTIVPNPPIGLLSLMTDVNGELSLQVAGGTVSPVTIYVQGVVQEVGGSFQISNALGADFLP